MKDSVMPKNTRPLLFQNRRMPRFSNGGHVWGHPNTPHTNTAATWLRADATWHKNGGYILHSLPPEAYVFEGHAKRHDRFGFAMFEDNSTILWTFRKEQRWICPAILSLSHCDLGPLGAWSLWTDETLPQKGPLLCHAQQRYRMWSKTSLTPVFSDTPPKTDDQRACAIIASTILQGLANYAYAWTNWPLVGPLEGTKLAKGWTRPAWWDGEGTLYPQEERAQKVRALVLPIVAKAYMADRTLQSVRIAVECHRRQYDGLVKPPSAKIVMDGGIHTNTYTCETSINTALLQAWTNGNLGDGYGWFHTTKSVVGATIDTSTLSNHTLLRMLARR